MQPNLSVDLCGFQLKNPVILASGILGNSAALLERVALLGAGGVTSKSCSLEPREGHPNPTVLNWRHGYINAVGLTNPGVKAQVEILKDAKERLAPLGTALIASIFADTRDHFSQLTHQINDAEPDFIEMNISCPNVEHDSGKPFSSDGQDSYCATFAVKECTDIPVIVKLSPNVTDIAEVACAVEEAGADAISAINTVSGMLIDVYAKRPILSNLSGGISGYALKPIAIRCVYECYESISIPIIGIGGVSTAEDAVALIMAGATAVGVGSAVAGAGPEVLGKIAQGMGVFMEKEGYGTVEQMRGIAHWTAEVREVEQCV